MKYLFCIFITIIVSPIFSQSMQPSSLEPRKYVNRDGIEIITNRPQTSNFNTATDLLISPTDTKSINNEPSVKGGKLSNKNSKLTFDKESGGLPNLTPTTRSSERKAILIQELNDEVESLEVKRRALESRRATVDLNDEIRTKLSIEIHRHEENIKAIKREYKSLAS